MKTTRGGEITTKEGMSTRAGAMRAAIFRFTSGDNARAI
jgi:hypothetical protein